MNQKPKLLLVDDHHLVLEGFRLELEEEFKIVGMLASGIPVLEECRRLEPDLVLLDLSLPDRGGLEVVMDLQRGAPAVKILVVTMHADPVLADAVMEAGAQGFVPKDAEVSELRTAIREVLAGQRYLSPLINERGYYTQVELAFGFSQLTPRQQEIVKLLGEGKSSARIAAELAVSPNTVTFHRVRIRKVLGIPTEWGLMRYALLVRMGRHRA
ncbi:MAG TPA: response regulator transcription factor [Gemmatimonadales bacterium]|nr:response regulator transcription factor [Gemmatimonadales bacterium]